MSSLLEYCEYDRNNKTEKHPKDKSSYPESRYISTYNHKGITCEKLLASFGLQENEIKKIITENTAREIKIVIYDIEKMYKNYKNSGITPEPNIGTYIFEVLNKSEENLFHH